MPRVLTEKQLRQYRRDGFVFPIDCISPEEAAGCMKKIGNRPLRIYRTICLIISRTIANIG